MTDLNHARSPGFSPWPFLARLLAPRARKRADHPRNPPMFVDRAMSRLPPHMLRDIGLFDAWPD